ncbi:hypothetical protein FISHEDRAFT_69230 [Fistulina hepatica ATCC 64428]|uniref:Uncharacterized protein n=1 Tax=Fistulina hepatica ATCC 64428 TaxID=1128425 RepID=A0A0D7AMJ3_9AGAR|nr:hypothetical protein FISHEDRAFT_69230 [Fistulina hepatica ATCC 64428]
MSTRLSHILRWRRIRLLSHACATIFILTAICFLIQQPPYAYYTLIKERETANSRALIAQKPDQKYVLFKQLQGAGFNNQFQEIVLFHHLALTSGRTYVYQPFVWRPRGQSALVPLSAFLRGVTNTSVSSDLFGEICPEDARAHIEIGAEVHEDRWAQALDMLNTSEPCIVVDNWILDWDFLTSPALINAWPTFSAYLHEKFTWSTSVDTIVDRTKSQLRLRTFSEEDPTRLPYMALHLRRGDFSSHCIELAESQAGFTTWATLPSLSRVVYPPALNVEEPSSIETHCYPSLRRILDIIDMHARARPHIRALHVLHDAAWDHPLVYLQYVKIKEAVMSAARTRAVGWSNGPMVQVTGSQDVPIYWGESDFRVAVDVELARQATVFIGNGYSSLSTQVLALRLGADGGKVRDIALT